MAGHLVVGLPCGATGNRKPISRTSAACFLRGQIVTIHSHRNKYGSSACPSWIASSPGGNVDSLVTQRPMPGISPTTLRPIPQRRAGSNDAGAGNPKNTAAPASDRIIRTCLPMRSALPRVRLAGLVNEPVTDPKRHRQHAAGRRIQFVLGLGLDASIYWPLTVGSTSLSRRRWRSGRLIPGGMPAFGPSSDLYSIPLPPY